MDTINCKYHPSVPAQWECIECNIDLCPGCIKKEPPPSTNAICPVCNRYLQAISISNIIKPFWARIPFFFTVPASAQSLFYILALSIGIAIFASIPSIFSFIPVLVMLLAFLRYAYVILDSTAFGRSKPPPIDYNMVTSELGQPIKQFLVFLVMGFVLVFVSRKFGPIAGLSLYFIFVLSIPATVMIIAIENSFIQAINPAMWFSIITRIGWSYLLLCLFLFLLGIGFFVATGMLVGENTAKIVTLFVISFVFMYFALIMFSMMGYVLYQYHEELGFAVSDEFEQASASGSSESAKQAEDPEVQHVNILISEGKHEEASGMLREALRKDPGNLILRDRYHKLLAMRKDVDQMLLHGKGYINQLILDHKLQGALGVYRDCITVKQDFRIANPDQVHELAQYAMQTRAYKLALALLNGFANHYSGHKDIPRNYFLAAKVLSEGLKQDAKAQKLLENLAGKYPNHELVPTINEYLRIIRKLTGTA
ncbi:MAG: DUF4013 domain-containing protein [Gammaproteobacteria bacterium]|nr:MAG: DUF4013 domain-containing protein [Gammaproteobacteria bacterium]